MFSHLGSSTPFYSTGLGSAYLGDSRELLAALPDESVNLVFTSPPYALHYKKEYGNVEKAEYVEWFMHFAEHFKRVLTADGSFVVNIGGSYNAGMPTRSLYHFKLLIELCDRLGFHLAQEFFWYNPAKLPVPAEWVNVRRLRVKDSVEYLFWLSKSPFPKASNSKVLQPYSPDMERLIERGYRAKMRPSGHNITDGFNKRNDGAIPSNLLQMGNNESNSAYIKACKESGIKAHPARFPAGLPEFFINFLTDPGDVVLDPFAGSNTTGMVAERLNRRWLAFELEEKYLEGSRSRFTTSPADASATTPPKAKATRKKATAKPEDDQPTLFSLAGV